MIVKRFVPVGQFSVGTDAFVCVIGAVFRETALITTAVELSTVVAFHCTVRFLWH